MADIRFHDISYAQGQYNMDADSSPIVFMKMSGFYYGSKTPYYDTQAARNYQNAIRTGKIPGLYHFAGGADPVAEADFFVGACSPIADGDIMILDYELTDGAPADPNAWCLAFVERVKERTGKYPIFYTYYAMLKQYGFAAVLERCGLWIAHYGVAPENTIPNCPSYIIHQYQGSPLDTNACFIELDTLRKYAYSSVQPQPEPPVVVPVPEPLPVPAPVPVEPAPTPDPTPEPTPQPEPAPDPEPTEPVEPSPPTASTPKTVVAAIIAAIVAAIALVVQWLHN